MFSKVRNSIVLWLVALSVSQAGTLYVTNNADNLLTIDTDTLTVSTVGPLGVDFLWSGLAYDPGMDVLYGVDGRAGQFELYSINRSTGVATSIGSHGISELFGLAFDTSTNTLYAAQLHGTENLYSIDTLTAQATLIGPLTGSPGIGGLAYDSLRDVLIGWSDFEGDVYSINRATGAATLLADNPDAIDGGLAYDPDKDIIWGVNIGNESDDGVLFTLDPANSYALTDNLIATLPGSVTGLAYVGVTITATPVPTLSVWALMLLALLLAAPVALIRLRKQ